MLKDVQEQSALLATLEQMIGINKEYLAKVCSIRLLSYCQILSLIPLLKVVKSNDSSWSAAAAADEELISGLVSQSVWEENFS